METIFFHLLRLQSTAASEAVFHLTRTYWKRFYLFCLLFYSEFFSVSGNLLKLGESPFLKTNHIPTSGHQFFQLFQRFFKVEAAFPYSGNAFFNGLHPASPNGFSAQRKQYFLVSAISLLVETIIGIRGKQFWEKEFIIARGKLTLWQVEIIFFSIFQRLLPENQFPLVRSFFKNWYLLISVSVSTYEEKLNKRKRFRQPENTFPTAGKTASAVRNLKIWRKLGYTWFQALSPPA